MTHYLTDSPGSLMKMLPPDREPEFPPDPVIEAYKKDVDRALLRER